MKFFIFLLLAFSLTTQAASILTYSYKGASNAPTKNLDSSEVALAYNIIKRTSYNPPNAQKFFQDYLKFKLGVEMAYYEKSLLKNPNIIKSIVSPALKGSFEQELYKAYAELKLKKQMQALDKRTANMGAKKLKSLYSRNPEFSYQYISINHPVGPSKSQVQEAKNRAYKVYRRVSSSKKLFGELVALHSDEKLLGALLANRSQAVIFPNVYSQLKRMRPGQISRPIRVATGYQIVRLDQKVPFERANQTAVKADFFNRERTRIFNNYFNLRRLQPKFKIKYVNRSLIKKLDSM